jgi:ESX secretion system ATPase EccB
MQTKRDQVQAHRTVTGRLGSAILTGTPDYPQPPMHRSATGAIVGIALGGLIAVGFLVWGLLSPGGNSSWQATGTLIVEKETSVRYVYADGELHPVLNYASARLLLGASMKIDSVSQKSLRGVPHGAPVGIPRAPDTLPTATNLTANHWLICAVGTSDASGTLRPITDIYIGSDDAHTLAVDADSAMLVAGPDHSDYLLWHGQRLHIDAQATLVALGYASVNAPQVAAQWLNAVPAGPDLSAPQIPARGSAGPNIDGHASAVGQVLVTQTTAGTGSYFVVLADGLAPISQTMASLLLGDPASSTAYAGQTVHAITISTAAVAGQPVAQLSGGPAITDLPLVPPHIVNGETGPATAPCIAYAFSATSGVSNTIVAITPGTIVAGSGPTGAAASSPIADLVGVEPGYGLLVAATATSGSVTPAEYLLTDLGVKYPLPSADAAADLGYGGIAPAAVPASLLAILPDGPVLDPAAAAAYQPVTAD